MGSVPAMKKGAIGCAARTVSISDPDRALSSSKRDDLPTGAGNFLPSNDMIARVLCG